MQVHRAVRSALNSLPAVLVLEAATWVTDPNAFAADFLFYFRALALSLASNDGSGGGGRKVGGRTAAELEVALVAPEPLSTDNERAALAAATSFLESARSHIDVFDGDGVGGCAPAAMSVVQRMRAVELAAVNAALEFVGDYEAGYDAHVSRNDATQSE
jgi:hypothetical protein